MIDSPLSFNTKLSSGNIELMSVQGRMITLEIEPFEYCFGSLSLYSTNHASLCVVLSASSKIKDSLMSSTSYIFPSCLNAIFNYDINPNCS